MLAIERRGFAANLGAGRKAPCRAATTGNITLSGEQTIDGVAVVADDRVLVKGQTNGLNAVYVVKTSDWQLASDFNQRGDVLKGSLVFVTDGTENGLTDWYVATSGRAWPGREAIEFQRYRPPLSVISGVWAGSQSYDLTPNDSSASVKTANTAAIQTAIDYAYANALQNVNIAPGVYYCDPGIYLDAPGNLRSSLSSPTIFNFSLHLRGAGGCGNHEGHGTQLRFTDNSTNALIVGTGQGMRVGELSIIGPSGGTRAAQSANGIGLALAGGPGGLSRCIIENVHVSNFRKGIVTGFNADGLCDSTTIFKCNVVNCYIGVHYSQTQNYIQSQVECTFSDCTTSVYSPVGKAVNIRGGNYSATDADNTIFTIGSTSSLTSFSDSFAGSSFTNWTFTTTLASHDQPMVDGTYDAFAIQTTGFGVIPLVLQSYNSSTRVATFEFYLSWLTAHYAAVDVKANTDIEAEIAAATSLYACETITPFFGVGFNVDGVHIENPELLTRLITTETGFAGDRVSHIKKLYVNYDINHASVASGTSAQKAAFRCQQVFPFIRMVQSGIVLSDSKFSGGNVVVGSDGVNVEVIGNTQSHRLISRNTDLYHPNVTVPLYDQVGTVALQPNMTAGAGEWDATPFIASIDSSQFYVPPRLNSVPFRGWRPEPSTTPRLTLTQLASLEGTLGSVGSYPPLHGGTTYMVLDDDASSPTATLYIRSAHVGFSYGQDLTIDWSYKGQTNIVTLSSLTRMFAGLRIGLDNGGGTAYYTVTGVYPTLGYVTVSGVLAGTKTTTYTGSTVAQQTYSISRSGNLPASKFTTNSTVGAATAASGDLTGADFVNVKLTAIGSTNYTTRTAAQMFSDIPGCYSGYKYMLAVSNVSTGNTVLAGGSGVTVNSTGNIPASSVRMFEARFTSTAALTLDGQLST